MEDAADDYKMVKKDCEMVFSNGQTYRFCFEDLPTAVKWGLEEHKDDVIAVKTPYGVLSLLQSDEYDKAMAAFAENKS